MGTRNIDHFLPILGDYMPAISCSAPGKIILCGEHAVVYGKPAIAIPIFDVSTKCIIVARPNAPSDETIIIAPAIGLKCNLSCLLEDHPIRVAIDLVLTHLNVDHLPVCEITIQSTLPTAAGLGSSASTSVALIRALSTFLGHPFEDEVVNQLAFTVEKIHHGTPSGIDNTVVTFGKTVYFVKEQESLFLQPKIPLTFVIADSGLKSSTSKVVAEVGQAYQQNIEIYSTYFERIGNITQSARISFESGDLKSLGKSLTDNHLVLQEMEVSCSKLDEFFSKALQAGALGAKLSGGGKGGNMIALVEPDRAKELAAVLMDAGAVNTIITTIPAKG